MNNKTCDAEDEDVILFHRLVVEDEVPLRSLRAFCPELVDDDLRMAS